MTKQEMEQYRDKKPIAVYPMSNWGGIEILDIVYDIEDYVIWRYNCGEPEEILHRAKIQTSTTGRFFIRLNESRIMLDECMRV